MPKQKSDIQISSDLLLEIDSGNRAQEERYAAFKAYIDTIVSRQTSEIVDVLVNERKALGLTQKDIADKIGVATSNVARFEGKKTVPTFQFLEKYARAVGKSMHYEVR